MVPPCIDEYVSSNDLHQLTHIDLMFGLMWNLMYTIEGVCVFKCVNVLSRVGGCLRAFCVFEHVGWFLHVQICVRVLPCSCVCVSTSGCLCGCVRCSVCVFMCLHVFCPLIAYLYPCCDIYTSPCLSRRVEEGPRETRREFNLLWKLCLFKPAALVTGRRTRCLGVLSLISYRSCFHSVLSGHWGRIFQHPALHRLGEGLDLLGYYSTSSFTRLLAKQRARSLNTQKNAYWITRSHSAALFLLFSLACSFDFRMFCWLR